MLQLFQYFPLSLFTNNPGQLFTSMDWDVFAGRESENNWHRRDEFLQHLIRDLERGTFNISLWKSHTFDVLQVLHTARTQLALTACKFVATLLCHLPPDERDASIEIIMANLLRVCGSTKKLVARMAQEALELVFTVAPANKVLTTALQTMSDKNVTLRQRIFEALLVSFKANAGRWLPRHWSDCEALLIRAVGDASPIVRTAAVELLTIVQQHCTVEVIAAMMGKLDLSTAKQLRQLLASRQPRPLPTPTTTMEMAMAIAIATGQPESNSKTSSNDTFTSVDEASEDDEPHPTFHLTTHEASMDCGEEDLNSLQSDIDAHCEMECSDDEHDNPFGADPQEPHHLSIMEQSFLTPVNQVCATLKESTCDNQVGAVASLVTIEGRQQCQSHSGADFHPQSGANLQPHSDADSLPRSTPFCNAAMEEDETTDDEVIIPMQKITISDNNSQPRPQSRIPQRSPSATRIALCTPYRHFIRHHHHLHQNDHSSDGDAIPIITSPSRISIESLVAQIRNVNESVPIATWKKLALVAETRHAQLTPSRIVASLEGIRARLDPFTRKENDDDDDVASTFASIGVLVRNLMALGDEYLELTPAILEIILVFNERFADFLPLWRVPPIDWLTMTRERIIFIVYYAQAASSPSNDFVAPALEVLHHIYTQHASDDVLAESLPSLNAIWMRTKDVAVKKAVVACVTTTRQRLGDSLFFQILPLLTVPQRRLLDAFMSMGA